MQKCLAVITGDIVGSSKMKADRRLSLYQFFPALSTLLHDRFGDVFPYPISNYRGDGWQAVVTQPEKAIEICLFIRTFFQFKFQQEHLDTRTAIGLGPVNFIPAENVSAGDGPAYLISGRLLESMNRARMAIDFTGLSDPFTTEALKNLVVLLDLIVTGWKPSQSQAVFWAMQGFNQSEIAAKWWPARVKQPAVSKSLNVAGWERVKTSLTSIERLLAHVQSQEEG